MRGSPFRGETGGNPAVLFVDPDAAMGALEIFRVGQ